eukprot:1826368-Pyramimonas_sp.AAC.1
MVGQGVICADLTQSVLLGTRPDPFGRRTAHRVDDIQKWLHNRRSVLILLDFVLFIDLNFPVIAVPSPS